MTTFHGQPTHYYITTDLDTDLIIDVTPSYEPIPDPSYTAHISVPNHPNSRTDIFEPDELLKLLNTLET